MNTVSSAANTGCDCDQLLLVAGQPDPSAEEGLLRVLLAGRDADRRVPVLLHPHVLRIGARRPERCAAVAHLEVVGHVALGSVGHDLGDPDRVRSRDVGERCARDTSVESASNQSRLRYLTTAA